jgi:hypothetical protein
MIIFNKRLLSLDGLSNLMLSEVSGENGLHLFLSKFSVPVTITTKDQSSVSCRIRLSKVRA